MENIIAGNNKYELIKNYRDAFLLEDFLECYTDFFEDYDFIVGDIAYSKLRLKGFYESKNKKVKEYNDIKNIDFYIINNCASDCKHFILKKIK